MKSLKLLFSLVLFCSLGMLTACFSDDPSKEEPIDQLPPLTTTGERTFGALINNKAYIAKGVSQVRAFYQGGGVQISANVDTSTEDWELEFLIKSLIQPNMKYILNSNHTGTFEEQIKNCEYITGDTYVGKINIIHLDEKNFIMSGTFEFDAWDDDYQEVIHVTDGRFDLKYSP